MSKERSQEQATQDESIEASRYASGVGFTVKAGSVKRLIQLWNEAKEFLDGEEGYGNSNGSPQGNRSNWGRRG